METVYEYSRHTERIEETWIHKSMVKVTRALSPEWLNAISVTYH